MTVSHRARRALVIVVAVLAAAALVAAASPASASPDPEVVAGDDRYATAAAIAERSHPDGADTVLLAAGHDFPDALAASGAAGALDAALLLVDDRHDRLPDVTDDMLDTLSPDQVLLVGGEQVLSPSLAREVGDAGSWEVQRVAGADRFATAAELADFADGDGARAYVATGRDAADALSVGPVAYRDAAPVLLTEDDELPSPTRAALADLDVDEVVVVGGPAAVSDAVADAVDAAGRWDVFRVAGENRFATATAVADAFAGDADHALLAAAYGNDGVPADALAAAPLSRVSAAALLPVDDRGDELADPVQAHLSTESPSELTVLGGPAAVHQRLRHHAAAYAAGEDPSQWAPPAGCPAGWVALTFDDGPDPEWTEPILDTLASRDARATFYVEGERVDERPDLVRRTAREGHLVGNHTYTHPDLTTVSNAEIRAQITRTRDAVERAGVDLTPVLRPPFRAVDGRVRNVAAELGHTIDNGTINPQDWRGHSPAYLVNFVVTNAYDGGNVLLHDGMRYSGNTAEALPAMIDGLYDRGFCVGAAGAHGAPVREHP